MKNKTITKLVLFTLILIISLNAVLAIGVSPAKKYIDFTPAQSQELSLKVYNNEHKDMTAAIYIQGELSQYIELTTNLITLNKNQEFAEVKYTITLPNQIPRPGIHQAEILIIELLDEKNNQKTAVNALPAVTSLIKLRVPYPDKYAEANLYIEPASINEEVSFTIPVFNYGTEPLTNVYAKIEILGATYQKIAEVQTNKISLNTKEESTLGAVLPPQPNPGIYHAIATVYYGNNNIRLEKNFEIGTLYVKINQVKVEDFTLGSIAKFDIYIENIWNQYLEQVFADVIFKDKQGTEYSRYKTATIDLKSYGIGKLEAYWNTKDLPTGEYELDVTLNYQNKTTTSLIETNINLDSISTNKIIGKAIMGSSGKTNTNNLLIFGLIILVIINIAWFFYFKKKKI